MATDDFFRARLDSMIGMRRSLAVPATRMLWVQIEAALVLAFARKDRKGNTVEGTDLFGLHVQAHVARSADGPASG